MSEPLNVNHRIVPEYDLLNPSTWTVIKDQPWDSEWERKLILIGGLNPFGEPMLIPRWGATYRDPMAEDNGLKYWLCTSEPRLVGHAFRDPVTGLELVVDKLDEVPSAVLISIPKYESIQLGERRVIVEQWASPELLSRSGRYRSSMLVDNGLSREFFFCRNCDTELLVDREPLPCHECGSKRHYLKEVRFEGDGKLLRDFPRRGCYDFFMRLENAEEKYMAPDDHALNLIRQQWKAKNRSLAEQMIDSEKELARQRWVNANATNPHNPFVAPAA